MKISKRSLLSVVALVLTMAVTAFGTVAYMTDSDTVTNTFTVGNIGIIVDEKNVDGIPDENGNIIPERDQQNKYHLIPGLEQDKDPRVTIMKGSEVCYVRMRVEMTGYNALKAIRPTLTDEQLLTQFVTINPDWTLQGAPVVNGNVVTYEYRYLPKTEGETEKVQASATENKILQSLFNTFTVPLDYIGYDLTRMTDEGFQLEVHGDAVQVEAFDNADEAWAAFDYQVFGVEPPATEETPNEGEGTEGTTGASQEGAGENPTDPDASQGGAGDAEPGTGTENGTQTTEVTE